MARTLVLFLCIGFLALSFNNCGRIIPGAGVESGVVSLQASLGQALCENRLKQTYASGYHSFFRSNCTTCHQHTSSHASPDLDVSFSAFKDKGQTTLEVRMNTPHGPGYAPPADASAQIAALRTAWTTANRTYQSCVAESGGLVTSAGDIDLMEKTPVNLQNTRNGNGTNTASFVQVSWNANTETLRGGDQGKLTATIRIDVGLLINGTPRSGAPIEGLVFRNPTMILNGISEYVSMDELAITIDGQEMSQMTTYKGGVLLAVSGTAAVNMAPGLGVAHAYKTGVTTTSKVALSIRGLKFTSSPPPTPTPPPVPTPPATPTPAEPISYTQLMGNDATKNIFAARCVSCHNGTTMSGMLDISTYPTAQARAAAIRTRVDNGTMPPNNPLNQQDREKVKKWVDDGAPENLPAAP